MEIQVNGGEGYVNGDFVTEKTPIVQHQNRAESNQDYIDQGEISPIGEVIGESKFYNQTPHPTDISKDARDENGMSPLQNRESTQILTNLKPDQDEFQLKNAQP